MRQRVLDFDTLDVVLRWKRGRLTCRWHTQQVFAVFFDSWEEALAEVLHPTLSANVRLRVRP